MAVDDDKPATEQEDAAVAEGEERDEDAKPGDSARRDEDAGSAADAERDSSDDAGSSDERSAAKPEADASKRADPAAADAIGRPAPGWLAPLYVAGLVLVFLGERVLSTLEAGRWIATGIGLAAVLFASVLRFSPRFRVGGERKQIEQLLGALSVAGLVALALYFATTDWGVEALGLTPAKEDEANLLGVLEVAWIAVLLASVVPMLFAEAALGPMRHAKLPESRRVRAAATSGLALALAAVYGALFVYAADGAELEVDYSYFKTAQASESTRKIAKSLKDPVRVIAFFPQVNEVGNEVEKYLGDVARGVPNLKVEVQDRLLVPKLARELRATRDGVVVLKKGEVNEQLSIGADMKDARAKLRTLDRDFQEKLLKLVRSRRTAYLTVGHGEINDTPRVGANEQGRAARVARTLLEKQNYTVKNLGLTQGLGSEVPDDASLVMVLGPSEPFAPEEIDTLKRYADAGGHLLLALDPDATPDQGLAGEAGVGVDVPGDEKAENLAGNPPGNKPGKEIGKDSANESSKKIGKNSGDKSGKESAKSASDQPGGEAEGSDQAPAQTDGRKSSLDALAAIAGLKFDETLLANDKQHLRRRFNASDRTLLISNRFSSHASVSTLSRNSARAAVVMFGSGALERGRGATGNVDFTVRALGGTFADENRNYEYDSGEKRSTFNMAAAVSQLPKGAKQPPKPEKQGDDEKQGKKPDDEAGGPEEMRAFVVADADAFTDLVMSNVLANQVLFVDAVRWLGGEESFAGEVSTEEDKRIEHTLQKDLVWFYTTIFGVPALVLGLGLLVSRRSRRSKGAKR